MASLITDALRRTQEAGADFVYLQFTDILGSVKGVAIPTSRLERAFDEGVWFDGSSVEGWGRVAESDLYLRPDPTSLALFPWESPPAARFICDLSLPTGQPFPGDPRQVLKRVIAESSEAGFEYRTSAEFEFFLFLEGGTIASDLMHGLEPSDSESYYSMPTERTLRLVQEVARTMERCGFAVAATHHEVAPGQHEIDLAVHDALRAADAIVTLKIALRAYSQRERLLVTFMPKPLADQSGSGLHFQQALFDLAGHNTFFEPEGTYHLSQTGRSFIAGQLAHARGMCALMAPLVNSYKRLMGGGEAPSRIDWARLNRGALIRVPELASDGQRMFVELRSPDPSCNPYLALAVALKAGLDGIACGTLLPDPVEERTTEEAEDAEQRVDPLPQTLGEAIEELEWDSVIRAALGESIYERFLTTKEQEWAAYRNHISLWELESYLQRV